MNERRVRIPKLYRDDGVRIPIQFSDGHVWRMTAGQIFDNAYREPHAWGLSVPVWHTVSDVISELTGYVIIRDDEIPTYFHRYGWWSERWHKKWRDTRDWYEFRKELRPAFENFRYHYYYVRDVIECLLPRRRCAVCDAKVTPPRRGWRLEGIARPWRDPDRCTSYCSRFEDAIGLSITHEERWLWLEHLDAPICSDRCHNKHAATYWRQVLHARRLRRWATEGKKSLRAVKKMLREDRKAPASRSAE